MAKSRAPTKPERPQHSTEQKRLFINRLNKRIQELEAFDPQTVQSRHDDPKVMELEAAIDETLTAAFGHNTVEYSRYCRAASLDNGPNIMRIEPSWISARHGGHSSYDSSHEARQYVAKGKDESLALLRRAIAFLEEEIEEEEYLARSNTNVSAGHEDRNSRHHVAQKPTPNPAYHIHISGENSRVNIHSTDSSTNTFNNQSYNYTEVASELATLRKALLERAQTPEHYVAIGAIASAETETKSGDVSKMKQALSTLGQAGKWALDVAKETGALVAAELIKSQIS